STITASKFAYSQLLRKVKFTRCGSVAVPIFLTCTIFIQTQIWRVMIVKCSFIVELMVANLSSPLDSRCPVRVSFLIGVVEVEGTLSRIASSAIEDVSHQAIHVIPSLSLWMGALRATGVPWLELLRMQIITCDRSPAPVSSVGISTILDDVSNRDLSFPRFSSSLQPHGFLENVNIIIVVSDRHDDCSTSNY
ncbi:hypothetical protein PMAYCL1PPCAC_05544, partial [Pristionchus mayeri]